jgi:hypothetical protein
MKKQMSCPRIEDWSKVFLITCPCLSNCCRIDNIMVLQEAALIHRKLYTSLNGRHRHVAQKWV